MIGLLPSLALYVSVPHWLRPGSNPRGNSVEAAGEDGMEAASKAGLLEWAAEKTRDRRQRVHDREV